MVRIFGFSKVPQVTIVGATGANKVEGFQNTFDICPAFLGQIYSLSAIRSVSFVMVHEIVYNGWNPFGKGKRFAVFRFFIRSDRIYYTPYEFAKQVDEAQR